MGGVRRLPADSQIKDGQGKAQGKRRLKEGEAQHINRDPEALGARRMKEISLYVLS